jgi:hypothetical protein
VDLGFILTLALAFVAVVLAYLAWQYPRTPPPGPPPPSPQEKYGEGWEWFYFADELETGVAEAKELRWRFVHGIVEPSGEDLPDRQAVMEHVQMVTRQAVELAENLVRILNDGPQLTALGAPGSPGDADQIRMVAAALTHNYRRALEAGIDLRSIGTPDQDSHDLLVALSHYFDGIEREYPEVVEGFREHVSVAIESVAGLPEGAPPLSVDIPMVITIPDEAVEGFEVAFEHFKATY